MKKRILVIDDEQMILDTMKLILEDMGYEVHGIAQPLEGEKEAINGDYNLIIVDLRMPERDGAAVTQGILKEKPDARILIQTAYPTDPLAKKALEAGALALVKKPFEIAKIIDFLKD